jgi:hypothetical protein
MPYGIKEDRNMPSKKHTPEENVAKMRQVDVLVSQGAPPLKCTIDQGKRNGASSTAVSSLPVSTRAKTKPFSQRAAQNLWMSNG